MNHDTLIENAATLTRQAASLPELEHICDRLLRERDKMAAVTIRQKLELYSWGVGDARCQAAYAAVVDLCAAFGENRALEIQDRR